MIKKLEIIAVDSYMTDDWVIDRFLDVAEKVNEIIEWINKQEKRKEKKYDKD